MWQSNWQGEAAGLPTGDALHALQAEGRAPLKSARVQRARRLFIAIATATFAIDLATKNWADRELQFREPIRILGDFLTFDYATNPGAAFSLLTEATLFLSSLKLVAVALVLYFIRSVTSARWASALALLLGGVLGNLYDRALRPPGLWRGEVIDWIRLPNWPTFNIADAAIVCAGIAMTILAMFNIPAREIDRGDDSDGGGNARA